MMGKSLSRECPRPWKLRISWMVLALGWAIWFISLWLPALGEKGGFLGQWPTALVPIFYFADIGEVLNGAGSGEACRFATTAVLLFLPYISAVMAAAGGVFFYQRRSQWWLSRLLSFGLFESYYYVWYFSTSWPMSHDQLGPRKHVLPGFPVLALGSTLICIGVWLIPPRRANIDGEYGKQSTTNNANPNSGTGGT